MYIIRNPKWKKVVTEWKEAYLCSMPFCDLEVYRTYDEDDKVWNRWRWSFCVVEYRDEGDYECKTSKEGKQLAFEYWLNRLKPALIVESINRRA